MEQWYMEVVSYFGGRSYYINWPLSKRAYGLVLWLYFSYKYCLKNPVYCKQIKHSADCHFIIREDREERDQVGI